jgi:hypothetical protein
VCSSFSPESREIQSDGVTNILTQILEFALRSWHELQHALHVERVERWIRRVKEKYLDTALTKVVGLDRSLLPRPASRCLFASLHVLTYLLIFPSHVRGGVEVYK